MKHFLSTKNPVATVDQREIEDAALRLIRRPEVERARKQATLLWLSVMEYAVGGSGMPVRLSRPAWREIPDGRRW
jgi:hypothetical protein